MRKATKTVATWFGVSAGVAGIEHGYFEILQGDTAPAGVMIESMGPPCVPEEIWNACEPALTILPNYLVTGILAVVIGLFILAWSLAFIHRKHGGWILILSSIALLLFGGGLFPPLIGIIGGLSGTRIYQPISNKKSSALLLVGAKLWPWPLVIFLVWIFGQFPVGYFWNDLMQSAMYCGVFVILSMLPLATYSAYAHDVQNTILRE